MLAMADPWTRREVIGDCTLYLGDMRDVLPALPERADMVATDAPYALTSGGNAKSMSGKFDPKEYDNSGLLMDTVAWQDMGGPIYRACKDSADVYVMCNDKHVGAAQVAFLGAGFKFHNLLDWNKGAPTRNRWYMKDQEYTLYFWKGRARVINFPGSKQSFDCPRPKGVGWHPTPKPVELMAHYILNSSNPGDLVLDPFVGSGSTVLAALAYGRRAVGIELNEVIFDQMCARVAAAQASGFVSERALCVAADVKGAA
jgi:site-specific DNA-methyltransferase (adenine-specific)